MQEWNLKWAAVYIIFSEIAVIILYMKSKFCALLDLAQCQTSKLVQFDRLEKINKIQFTSAHFDRLWWWWNGLEQTLMTLVHQRRQQPNLVSFKAGVCILKAEYYPRVFHLCTCTWKQEHSRFYYGSTNILFPHKKKQMN